MHARIERGPPTLGGLAPYGYKYIPAPKQGRLEVAEAEATALAVEIAGYEVELVNLERQLTILTSGAPDEEALKRLCADLAKGMDIFEPADRHGVIELLDVRATAYKGITVAEDKIVVSGLISTFSISTDGEYVKLDPVETPSESET